MEAIFLLRAYRTTLTRFGETLPIDSAAMAVRRRISATYKDLPGGQVLGPSYDSTHRLLDFALAAEDGVGEPQAACAERPVQAGGPREDGGRPGRARVWQEGSVPG